MRSATANKNVVRAYGVANFTRSTWMDDPAGGEKSWNLKLLEYYSGVKDTLSYLRTAAQFYERHYMLISTDSVWRRDSVNFESARMRAINNSREAATAQYRRVSRGSSSMTSNGEIPKTVRRDTAFRTVSFSVSKDMYATELNNAAWSFYLMGRQWRIS